VPFRGKFITPIELAGLVFHCFPHRRVWLRPSFRNRCLRAPVRVLPRKTREARKRKINKNRTLTCLRAYFRGKFISISLPPIVRSLMVHRRVSRHNGAAIYFAVAATISSRMVLHNDLPGIAWRRLRWSIMCSVCRRRRLTAMPGCLCGVAVFGGRLAAQGPIDWCCPAIGGMKRRSSDQSKNRTSL
jgi:hypothetical protein